MNEYRRSAIAQVALDYARKETSFAYMKIMDVNETNDYSEIHGQFFAVRIALSHSAEDIERLVVDGPPEEAIVRRGFLEGEFILKLMVAGDSVVGSEWEHMDIC